MLKKLFYLHLRIISYIYRNVNARQSTIWKITQIVNVQEIKIQKVSLCPFVDSVQWLCDSASIVNPQVRSVSRCIAKRYCYKVNFPSRVFPTSSSVSTILFRVLLYFRWFRSSPRSILGSCDFCSDLCPSNFLLRFRWLLKRKYDFSSFTKMLYSPKSIDKIEINKNDHYGR